MGCQSEPSTLTVRVVGILKIHVCNAYIAQEAWNPGVRVNRGIMVLRRVKWSRRRFLV